MGAVSASVQVGIVGGTGPAGRALAARLAAAGVAVTIGSRSAERAQEVCNGIAERWPDLTLALHPAVNSEAADAPLVVLATVWDAAAATAEELAERLSGKVVISMGNALAMVDGELRPVDVPAGSVAAAVQQAAPGALVAAAFQHLPARSLADLSRPAEGDVLICSDDQEAAGATAELVRRMPDLRPVHAGSLAAAGAVEAFTAVLLGINKRYKGRSSIRLMGLDL